jgi:hypothetical protein
LDGFGSLGANHPIYQKACLGLLPSLCREFATVDPSSCVVKFFNEEFKLRIKLSQSDLDRFLATLSNRLEVVCEAQFTERILENVQCKAFHLLNKPKTKKPLTWYDTLSPQQRLYGFNSDSIFVISPNGDKEEVEGVAIVNRFPFGDRLLNMEELVIKLRLARTMPPGSFRRRYQLSSKVWCPKAKFKVNFYLPPTDQLSNKIVLQTRRTILTKWIGDQRIPRKREQMCP